MIYSGNIKTIYYIRKFGGTSSPLLLKLAERIWKHCLNTVTRPHVNYIPSILNPKDNPSRMTAQTEWSLKEKMFKKIQQVLGKNNVDLFASVKNKKLKMTIITLLWTTTIRYPESLTLSVKQPLIIPATAVISDPKSGKSPLEKKTKLALKETSIKSFIRPSYDVTPIINELIAQGPSDKFGISKLTSKFCWFISICEFLCASDINRIGNSLTAISNKTLKFVIIAPKEKRNDQPILKPCEIRSHSNPIFCLIEAYKAYKEFTHTIICKKHHTNHPEIELLILMRQQKIYRKPLV
ncbi:hypothetical protein BB560_000756 [Smittium megazygosporum]|uniref:Uncharacterized protein n=1 Tax=Smittium megazygosporum TaxID=133381 RepID=A0A2T9ZJE6_9FUNG|nr:hypothetical protein BB560_000756 [Smittium megazygosporum]